MGAALCSTNRRLKEGVGADDDNRARTFRPAHRRAEMLRARAALGDSSTAYGEDLDGGGMSIADPQRSSQSFDGGVASPPPLCFIARRARWMRRVSPLSPPSSNGSVTQSGDVASSERSSESVRGGGGISAASSDACREQDLTTERRSASRRWPK
jgi:hypothetical protein